MCHGNEPGHHIPYLYNWTSSPWKTQQRVRMIMDTMYSNEVDGLCGNDDARAEFLLGIFFSSLGFYPVLPGSNQYAIGSPMVNKAVLRLDNDKELVITAINQSKENVYVQKIEINGIEASRTILTHDTISNGGSIVFYLGKEPNKEWGKLRALTLLFLN